MHRIAAVIILFAAFAGAQSLPDVPQWMGEACGGMGWFPLIPPMPYKYMGETSDIGYAQLLPPKNASIPPRYPHALFALEAGALVGALAQATHSYSSYEDQSATKFSVINIPIVLLAGWGGYKLESSHKKPLRILGHAVMWGAVAGYSADYFHRRLHD